MFQEAGQAPRGLARQKAPCLSPAVPSCKCLQVGQGSVGSEASLGPRHKWTELEDHQSTQPLGDRGGTPRGLHS
jgi:hypothetical protein